MARNRPGKDTSETSSGGAAARQPRPRPVGKTKVDKQGTVTKGVRSGRAGSFFQEMVAELRKVTWPNRSQLVQATAVVLVFVLVVTAYLAGLDAIFEPLVDRIF